LPTPKPPTFGPHPTPRPFATPRLPCDDAEAVVLQLDGLAAAHPELVIAVMNAASSDWTALRLGVAMERVAEALLVEEEAVPGRRDAVVAVHGVLRP
jgi:hypothetical protein